MVKRIGPKLSRYLKVKIVIYIASVRCSYRQERLRPEDLAARLDSQQLRGPAGFQPHVEVKRRGRQTQHFAGSVLRTAVSPSHTREFFRATFNHGIHLFDVPSHVPVVVVRKSQNGRMSVGDSGKCRVHVALGHKTHSRADRQGAKYRAPAVARCLIVIMRWMIVRPIIRSSSPVAKSTAADIFL